MSRYDRNVGVWNKIKIFLRGMMLGIDPTSWTDRRRVTVSSRWRRRSMSVEEAIASDWVAVGDDLRLVMHGDQAVDR